MKVFLILCLIGVALASPVAQRLQDEEEFDSPDPYEFHSEVISDEYTNYQSHSAKQDENGVVNGQWSYVAPNGIRYTYTYYADAETGFQVDIQEEQTGIEIVQPPHLRPENQ
ncbi:larval cuticle protein 9-like [Oratosquilla oratoria]|uniref:larval cuticle protein 9-like n=1 Tax=Oratosquilla oratoria TaxID=337810 RepID=UPI003F76EE4D